MDNLKFEKQLAGLELAEDSTKLLPETRRAVKKLRDAQESLKSDKLTNEQYNDTLKAIEEIDETICGMLNKQFEATYKAKEEEEKAAKEAEEEEKAKEAEAKAEAKRKEKEEAQKAASAKPEAQILAKLDDTGRIHFKDLSEIVGQNVSAPRVKVGKLILDNIPFTDYYRAVNVKKTQTA
jgi:hypothetical protein